LPDQFINSQTNTRTDAYGGSIAGRSRLLFEVVEAVKGVWGGDRVGVRLSPLGSFNDIGDSDPETTFGTIAEQLSGHDLAYLHLINPATADLDQGREPNARALAILNLMRAKYRGTLMLAGGFDRDSAETWLKTGRADVIAFGRNKRSFGARQRASGRFRGAVRLGLHVVRAGLHRFQRATAIRVEFEDGFKMITSRNAVRKASSLKGT
jgi:N-ethylmaleimide reductase